MTPEEWNERLADATRTTVSEWQEVLVEAVKDLEAQAEKRPGKVGLLHKINADINDITWAKTVISLKGGPVGMVLKAIGRPRLTTGVELAQQVLDGLTPEQRLEAFSDYCGTCGDVAHIDLCKGR